MREWTLDATVENIGPMLEFIGSYLDSLNCPMKAQVQLNIAADELLSNIARYAYQPSVGPVTVCAEVMREPLAVVLTFIDRGRPFDPLKSTDPDISLSSDERELGGLGIYIVKKSMDEITYAYQEGRNILRIRKDL